MIDLLAASVLIGAASYRLWRLVHEDKITERFQHWLDATHLDALKRPRLNYFVHCPWCLGSIIAFAITTVAAVTGFLPPRHSWLVALAAAAVTGLIADRS